MIEIIENYWAQITILLGVVLGGIGYLLRLYFDWNIKKREITYINIRETKITQLKEFYTSYIDLETNLKRLHYAIAKNNNDEESVIWNKIPSLWQQFNLNLTLLRIFLNTDELKIFEELNNELNDIQKKIDFFTIDREFGNYGDILLNELRYIRDEIFPKRIPKLMQKIESNLRNDFNIK